MNRFGMYSILCGVIAILALFSLSGVHMPILLFAFMFLALTIAGLVFAVKAKNAIYLLTGGLLNGLLLIYTVILTFAS